MFALTGNMRYLLYNEYTDMRNSFDGLCGIVQNHMHRNPLHGDVFVFINKRRDCIKLLHWEQGGFVLYYKRLEHGTIELPKTTCEKTNHQAITWPVLMMMIEGISIKHICQRKRYSISPVFETTNFTGDSNTALLKTP
jgi:transposase